MNIGVAGPFNPMTVKTYFDNEVDLPDINGMATSVNAYVNGLLQLGHSVTVFTTCSFDGEAYTIEGRNIRICFISTQFKIHALGRLRMARKIRKSMEPYIAGLDVLHAEWTYEFALAIKAFKDQLPLFCSVRDWAPYIYSLAKKPNEKYYYGLSLFIFKLVMMGDDIHFIANSEYTKKQILSKYPEKEVVIIPNPMDSKNILTSRVEYPKDPVFISISTSPFTPRKNNLILLEAFSAYRKNNPNAKLIVVGSYSEDVKDRFNQRGLLDGVELVGSVDHEEVIRLIDQSSCLVHPALEETFGNILLEGMCRRVLCIGGENSGAVPQVLGYGKYGILCDVTCAESLEAAMESIKDKETFDRLVNDSTMYITQEFTEKTVANKHLSLFKDSINK